MKITKKISIFLFIMVVFLSSCQEDNLLKRSDSEKQLIEEARRHFEEKISDAVIQGKLVKDKVFSPGEVVPEWKEATVKKNENFEYVFVPIYTQKEYVVRYKKLKKSGEEYYARCRASQMLCIYKNNDGVINAAYMTLIPTIEYYNKNRNKVVTQYLKNSNFHSNFTGGIAYTDIISSRLLAVDKIEKGEVDWGFNRKTAPTKETFKQAFKQMFENVTIFQGITTRGTIDGGELEEVVFIWCTKCKKNIEEDHWCDDWLDDEDDDDDDNRGDGEYPGGGGSGGGGSIGGGEEENKAKTKINDNIKIPNHLQLQPEGTKTCVPFSMHYALKLMGEKGGPYKLMDEFSKKYGINFEEKGMEISKLNNYLSEGFNTQPFVSYQNTVDKGYLQIINTTQYTDKPYTIDGKTHRPDGTPYIGKEETPHAVLLIGYTTNSKGVVDSYIVLDPLTGGQRTINSNDIRNNPPHSIPFSTKK